ncbi:MAG TPA: SIS domain-containing protein [Paludibaculum sp.]|jgi:D-sedoheptulose 7-phosphate isomerase
MNSFPATYLESLQQTLCGISVDKVNEAIEWLRQAREEGRTIFTCGNGGSASTASHFVCDVLKGASFNRPKRFRIMALTDSLPTLTAYSNDVSYDCVFVEQLKNFGQPGDILLSISGSGNSPNVLRAVEYANQAGLKTIGLTGRDGGQLGRLSQLEINVADPHMGRIEDGHMIICHMLAYYFMDTEKAGGGC